MLVKLKTSSLDNLSRVYSQLKESSGGSKPVRHRETTPVVSKPPQHVKDEGSKEGSKIFRFSFAGY